MTCVRHFVGATAHSGAYFGEGKGAVNLDSVECTGSEYILTDCQIDNSGMRTSHSLDVGVKCQPGSYNMFLQMVYTLIAQ